LLLIQLFSSRSPVMLALRYYKKEGPYFIIKMRRSTGDIINCYRINELPLNWPESFIQEMKDIADVYFVNRSKQIIDDKATHQ